MNESTVWTAALAVPHNATKVSHLMWDVAVFVRRVNAYRAKPA